MHGRTTIKKKVVSVFDSLKGSGPQIRLVGFFFFQTLPTLETFEYYIYISNYYEI
jgi:hypothetical protein